MAGRVQVDGRPMTKPGSSVPAGALLDVARPRPFVSRGGEKLEGALADCALDPSGARALDVGASTGGFTDCLLRHGARSVVALDVGYGQLALSLRNDARVTVIERTNFRLLPDEAFGAEFDLITIDASFISVVTLVARARTYLAPGGAILALVKPQFEAGKARLGANGVVRDAALRADIVREAYDGIAALGLTVVAAARSHLRGPAGNVEVFFRIERTGVAFDPALLAAVAAEPA